MAILGIYFNNVGQTGQNPQFIYIDTNDTVAQVTVPGFLNASVASGIPISESLMAVVTTRATPNAATIAVNLFNITFTNGQWSLTSINNQLALPNDQIFIGNSSNVAAPVTMSGDATISNTGVLTVANAAITLAKLAAGVAPAAIVKFAAQYTTVGGAAAEAITVTGAVAATDRAFVQLVNQGPNTVTVLTAVVTANTLTVTFSGNPGAGAIINYQLLRAAT
jgi:hypothetical protein